MAESSPNGRKHCGKTRNCSLRAIFPIPKSVFKRNVLQTRTRACLEKELMWIKKFDYKSTEILRRIVLR